MVVAKVCGMVVVNRDLIGQSCGGQHHDNDKRSNESSFDFHKISFSICLVLAWHSLPPMLQERMPDHALSCRSQQAGNWMSVVGWPPRSAACLEPIPSPAPWNTRAHVQSSAPDKTNSGGLLVTQRPSPPPSALDLWVRFKPAPLMPRE